MLFHSLSSLPYPAWLIRLYPSELDLGISLDHLNEVLTPGFPCVHRPVFIHPVSPRRAGPDSSSAPQVRGVWHMKGTQDCLLNE